MCFGLAFSKLTRDLDPAYRHPEPLDDWYKEVFRLLRATGYLPDVLRSWGVPETEIAAMAASMGHRGGLR